MTTNPLRLFRPSVRYNAPKIGFLVGVANQWKAGAIPLHDLTGPALLNLVKFLKRKKVLLAFPKHPPHRACQFAIIRQTLRVATDLHSSILLKFFLSINFASQIIKGYRAYICGWQRLRPATIPSSTAASHAPKTSKFPRLHKNCSLT